MSIALSHLTALPVVPTPDPRPLTVEWLVALDIDSFRRRRDAHSPERRPSQAAGTMGAQASTRPSPASLRKNSTAHPGGAQ